MPLERSPHAPFTLWQVGVPMDPKGHDLTKKLQSAKDTLHERQLATMLQEEVDQFGDINVLPMRDQYQDLTNKFLGVEQPCCPVCLLSNVRQGTVCTMVGGRCVGEYCRFWRGGSRGTIERAYLQGSTTPESL